jgi:hypothetical protein
MPPPSEAFIPSSDLSDYPSDTFTEDVPMDSSSDSRHSQSGSAVARNGSPDDAKVYRKVKAVFCTLDLEGLNLGVFIHAVAWGNPLCASDKEISAVHAEWLQGPLFPSTLELIMYPPFGSSNKQQPLGGCIALTSFMECQWPPILKQEMHAV